MFFQLTEDSIKKKTKIIKKHKTEKRIRVNRISSFFVNVYVNGNVNANVVYVNGEQKQFESNGILDIKLKAIARHKMRKM